MNSTPGILSIMVYPSCTHAFSFVILCRSTSSLNRRYLSKRMPMSLCECPEIEHLDLGKPRISAVLSHAIPKLLWDTCALERLGLKCTVPKGKNKNTGQEWAGVLAKSRTPGSKWPLPTQISTGRPHARRRNFSPRSARTELTESVISKVAGCCWLENSIEQNSHVRL